MVKCKDAACTGTTELYHVHDWGSIYKCQKCSKLTLLSKDEELPTSSRSTGAVGYKALVAKLDEYIRFLGEDSKFRSMLGGCSEERFNKGILLRSQINRLRKAL